MKSSVSSIRQFAHYQTGPEKAKVSTFASDDELCKFMKNLQGNVPFFVLGRGTNSLVGDDPWAGEVITLRGFSRIEKLSDTTLYVGAGVENSFFAEEAFKLSLAGAAWMNGLPGELGGTVRMNARCYGGEISQLVTAVFSVTREGEKKVYRNPKEIFRGYKDTHFMHSGEIITGCEISLTQDRKPEETRAKMDFCIGDRRKKGQFDHPSCGCVFKNDYKVGVPSGLLLEKVGAKELRVGNAQVSPFHANFVYNTGDARSADILHLTQTMREAVYLEFGVWMIYEMELLGAFPADVLAAIREKRPARGGQKLIVLREEFQKKALLQ